MRIGHSHDIHTWGCMVEDTNGFPQMVQFQAAGGYEAEQYSKSVWGDRVTSIPWKIT